jgi:hypothetical protein
MSVLLYIIGALAFAAGVITLGFGFSIELSFGNSLIVAGASAAVGGLIVFGLGAVVSQLQRIVEGLATRAPIRPSRIPEMFEAPGAATPRAPFPPRPKSGLPRPPEPTEPPVAARSPASAEMPAEDHFAGPPTLPNPDTPPVEVHEEVSLSPFQPAAPSASVESAEAARPAPPFGFGRVGESRPEPETDAAWRLPPAPARPEIKPPPLPEEPPAPPRIPTHFDTMWPAAEPKSSRAPDFGKPEGKSEPKAQPSHSNGPAPARPEVLPPRVGSVETHGVAILKSGVVDGMGYTLYVDGSIEAELPQGTLRFTSINDLRNYLEKNAQS